MAHWRPKATASLLVPKITDLTAVYAGPPRKTACKDFAGPMDRAFLDEPAEANVGAVLLIPYGRQIGRSIASNDGHHSMLLSRKEGSLMLRRFRDDEAGAVLSAEVVLLSTVLVIGVLVGLTELQEATVNELNDVGEAVGALNQSLYFRGQSSREPDGSLRAFTSGSVYIDGIDSCDGNESAISCDLPVPEVRTSFLRIR